jgi:hypothetical protein
MIPSIAGRLFRAEVRRFANNPANLKLFLLLPPAVILSLWPYTGSPFVSVFLLTFATLEPQFNNIFFRSEREFEALVVLPVDWATVILAKNLATITLTIAVAACAGGVLGYFSPLPMGPGGWREAFLYMLSVIFPLLMLGNLHSVQHPRRKVGLGLGDVAEALLMLLGMAVCSIPFLALRGTEHPALYLLIYSALSAGLWRWGSIPRSAAAVRRERIRLCQTE